MIVKAFAKINWALDVQGAADGYHLLDMLMQPISLADTLEITENHETGADGRGAITFSVTGGGSDIPCDPSNLAMKAALALREAAGCDKGAAIRLTKRIPSGAGMGGGSADAAAVLIALNTLWKTRLSSNALEAIGKTLGADVPFCVRGGLQRVRGIGERMSEAGAAHIYALCVVKPEASLPTKDVFRLWDQVPDPVHPSIDAAEKRVAAGLLPGNTLGNALQTPAELLCGEITKAIRDLTALGADAAVMTGSGSAVFGVFADAADAQHAADALCDKYAFCAACETRAKSVEIED